MARTVELSAWIRECTGWRGSDGARPTLRGLHLSHGFAHGAPHPGRGGRRRRQCSLTDGWSLERCRVGTRAGCRASIPLVDELVDLRAQSARNFVDFKVSLSLA
jgi:hypothetical protein